MFDVWTFLCSQDGGFSDCANWYVIELGPMFVTNKIIVCIIW